MTKDRKNLLKVGSFLVFIFICAVATRHPAVRDRANLEWVNAQLQMLTEFFAQPWGPAAYIGLSAGFIILQIPGLVLTILGAFVFPPVQAFLYAWIGANIGTIALFFAGRTMLYDFFAPRLEKSFLGGVMGRLESGGFVWTCVLRAIFFMSPPLSWMMGASSVRTKDYVLGNLVGLTPVIFLVQMASRRLSEVHKASDLLAVEPMVYFGAFLAFVVLAVYLRKRFLNR